YKLAAAIAFLAYYNFGGFHAGHWLHKWELFHYDLGSKYFPELGYDGLYAASVAAQRTTSDSLLQPHLRDLRTNEIVPTLSLLDQLKDVLARFTPHRFHQFEADHRVFLDTVTTNPLI